MICLSVCIDGIICSQDPIALLPPIPSSSQCVLGIRKFSGCNRQKNHICVEKELVKYGQTRAQPSLVKSVRGPVANVIGVHYAGLERTREPNRIGELSDHRTPSHCTTAASHTYR